MKPRLCKQCGRNFVPIRGIQVFCSNLCRLRHYAWRQRKSYRRKHPNCAECGKKLGRDKRKYCSDECRNQFISKKPKKAVKRRQVYGRQCKHEGCPNKIPISRASSKIYCVDHDLQHGVVHRLNLEKNTYIKINLDTGEILEKGKIEDEEEIE